MYLKSDETEGNLLSEHMNIFAINGLLVPKGVILDAGIIRMMDFCTSSINLSIIRCIFEGDIDFPL